MSKSRSIAKDVIIAAQAGEEEAFAKIVDYYRPLAYYLVFQKVRNTYDTDDLVQDLFIHIWENLGKFDPDRGSFTPWFGSVTKNLILNFHENKKKEKAFLKEYRPDDKPLADDYYRDIDVSLSQLSDILNYEEYTTLILKLRYNVMTKEICEFLGITFRKYRQCYNSALNKIEKLFANLEDLNEKQSKKANN